MVSMLVLQMLFIKDYFFKAKHNISLVCFFSKLYLFWEWLWAIWYFGDCLIKKNGKKKWIEIWFHYCSSGADYYGSYLPVLILQSASSFLNDLELHENVVPHCSYVCLCVVFAFSLNADKGLPHCEKGGRYWLLCWLCGWA